MALSLSTSRGLVRLSIPIEDRTVISFLSSNTSVPTRVQWFLNCYTQTLPGQLSESSLSKHLRSCLQDLLPTSTYQFHMLLFTYLQASCRSIYCPNTSLVSPGPSPNFSLSRYSQCSSPDRLSEPSLVQAPHLCLQDLLPTSACRDIAKQNMSSLAIN